MNHVALLHPIDPLSFFTVVFGGLIIGVAVGAVSAFILKFTEHVRVIEPLIVFSTAYYAFILAECIHWSGIIRGGADSIGKYLA